MKIKSSILSIDVFIRFIQDNNEHKIKCGKNQNKSNKMVGNKKMYKLKRLKWQPTDMAKYVNVSISNLPQQFICSFIFRSKKKIQYIR